MPVTMQQVLAYVSADEPRYAEAARLGEEALPHLLAIVAQADIALASKAVYLAALITSREAGAVVQLALEHQAPSVRVAAASTLPLLPQAIATPLILGSLDDEDAGVRRLALDAFPERPVDVLRERLEQFMRDDAEPGLRLRADRIRTHWRELDLSLRYPASPNGELLAAFPVSDHEIVLHFKKPLPSTVDPRMFRSARGIQIRGARVEQTSPHEVVLDIEPLPRLPLAADSIAVSGLVAGDGSALGELQSPRFLHGVHSAMELKVPHAEAAFPFRSTLSGLHATVECCTGCNGGIHDRDLVVVNNHSGGGWSGIWVRTAKVIDGPYPRWQRVMFAGGILADEDGSLTLVDHGWMRVAKGDEAPHHAPPPLPVRTKDVPATRTESLLTKSLDGTWVELTDVKVVSAREVAPLKSEYSRTLRRIELLVDDGSGPANAWMYQPSSAKVEVGQALASLRGFVHAEAEGVYALLSDKEEDLRF